MGNSILDALASGEVYMPQDQDFTLTEEVLQGAVSTTCVTEDGQNVIIIVAPPSPAHSNVYTSDTDPEWVPSPASSVSPSSPLRTISSESRGMKKKGQQNTVEEELELLAIRNKEPRAKLTEMETEARLLKKLMTEAGLGRIASTMKM